MNTVPRLTVTGLYKAFFGVTVLRDVSFEAYAGEVLGIVGENGSGKSTTMNILAGVLPRDAGSTLLDGQTYLPRSRREADALGVAFIQQELSIFPNLSVAENLFLGRFPRRHVHIPIISRAQMRHRARDLLRSVDLTVDPDVDASTLSPGERQLLEIARALRTDSRIMIFDEPTTSLSQREASRLFEIIERLRASGVTILYISHALEDVLRLSNRVVVMRGGQVTLQASSAHVSPHDLIVAMVGHTIETLFPERSSHPLPATHLVSERGNDVPVLNVDGVGEPGAVLDVSLHICKGEIVGLAGLMGSGRSELARILFGVDAHSQGVIRIAGRALPSGNIAARIEAGMAFLTEDRRHEGLMMNASVADNMALAALPLFTRRFDGRVQNKPLTSALQSLASRLNLKSGPIDSAAVRTLSGGNQQKVVLARWLLRHPSLFILDEPTRGVDVGAKAEIYRLLARMADDGMAILVISSEMEELIGIADRILVMQCGQLRAQFERAEFDRELILKAAFGQQRGTA